MGYQRENPKSSRMFSHLNLNRSMHGWFWQIFFVFSRVEHVHDEKVQFSTRNTMEFFS